MALGSNDNHTVKAFVEAESYEGPSIIIAYSHCIAHGINMRTGMNQHKLAVDSGHWPLYRFDPRRVDEGLNPLQLDSRAPKIPIKAYVETENRFRILMKGQPERAARLMDLAQQAADVRYQEYARRARPYEDASGESTAKAKPAPASTTQS